MLNSFEEFFLSTSRDSIINMELTRKMLMLIHIRFTSPFLNPISQDTDQSSLSLQWTNSTKKKKRREDVSPLRQLRTRTCCWPHKNNWINCGHRHEWSSSSRSIIFFIQGWGTWMTGRMTGRTDGKDDPHRTKPSLLYK